MAFMIAVIGNTTTVETFEILISRYFCNEYIIFPSTFFDFFLFSTNMNVRFRQMRPQLKGYDTVYPIQQKIQKKFLNELYGVESESK